MGALLGSTSSVAADAGAPALPVTTAVAQRVERPALQQASGTIAAFEDISISARVAGLALLDLKVRVGDRVQKGQLLAKFDQAPVLAEVAQADAALLQAKASADEAAANRDRVSALKASGAMSAQDMLQLTTRSAVAQGQLAQAKAARAAAQLRLNYTQVTAPNSGVVSSRTAVVGAVPQLGSELFRLIAQDRLEWRAELSGLQLAKVKPGFAVTLNLPDGHDLRGRVRQIAPTLDPATRLGLVYVDLDHSAAVRANMYAKGAIELDRRTVLLVPAESIVTRDGRSYAVTMVSGRAKLVPVTVGQRLKDETEVLAGLNPGEIVIVRGAGFVSEGTRVHETRAALGAP